MVTVLATWTPLAALEEENAEPCTQQLVARVEEKPLVSDPQSVAAELTLDALPWRLVSDVAVGADADAKRCELTLDFGDRALQCKTLQLQIASSARHVEVYIDGVRRNLLGEDERSDVYLGTFRGAKATGVQAALPQRFDVCENFTQTTRDHDVLKRIHRLRIKFLSLTGDKNTLELTTFRCLYVATASPKGTTSMKNTSAMPSAADVVDMMASLSHTGGPTPLNPQMILLMVQQMMEREVETKIAQALDAKLSVLAQRLAFSEQMLLQVQQKTAAKDAQLEHKLEKLQQQLTELRDQVVVHQTDTVSSPDA